MDRKSQCALRGQMFHNKKAIQEKLGKKAVGERG